VSNGSFSHRQYDCFHVQGEEDKGANMERFVVQLAGLADVFVNDAFGSWQPHASTFYITKYLPSYAGLCMQVCMYINSLHGCVKCVFWKRALGMKFLAMAIL
jgi:3-phosphoglycerate kinase